MNSLRILKKNKWYILAFAIAILIRVFIAVPLVHDWDGFVFLESAKNMLHGITPYETVEQNDPIIYPNSDRPMTEQWYAYPPLPLIMFTISYASAIFSGINIVPAIENIFLKIPFIFGDILFALLAFKFLKDRSIKLAERAMLLILFNPFLIWISSAWGMFDVWIINFILLFLLALRSEKFLLAGFFLALAPEVKLFPVFFLPAIFIYIVQVVKQNSHRIKIFSSFIVTTIIFVAPFLLSNPQGFMNQNLIMHLNRSPQGIGFVAMFDFLSHIYNFDVSLLVIAGSILMVLSILIFNLLSIVFIKGKVERLFMIMFLIYTSVLVFNKVVNEQYFVIFIGFLIILTHFPKREVIMFSKKFLSKVEWIATVSVLFAGVMLGFHFLTFLPSFISEGYFKTSTNHLVFYLSKLVSDIPLYVYPNSIWTYYNLPVVITYLALIPLISLCFYIILKGFAQVFLLRKNIYSEIFSYFSKLKLFLTIKNTTASIFLLVVIISLSIPLNNFLKQKNAFELIDLVDEKVVADFPVDPKVGVFYYTWWNNPSLNKNLSGDAWEKVTTSPEVGFYTSKNSYFVRHIKQMKEVGIEFAAVSYHLYDRERYLVFGDYAEKLGLYYAPLIETANILDSEIFKPVDSKGNKFLGLFPNDKFRFELKNIIISSIVENYNSPALFRIDDKPVVFIYDGHWFFPSWDYEFKKRLAHRIVEKYKKKNKDPFISISNNWGVYITSEEEMMNLYPKDISSFNKQTSISKDYHQAFLSEYEDFWIKLRHSIEKEVGPVYLLSTYTQPTINDDDFIIRTETVSSLNIFDNEFFYSLSNTWASWRYIANPKQIMDVWEKQEKDQAIRNNNNNKPVFLTTTPTYKDTIVRGVLGFEIPKKVCGKSVYEWTWEVAMKNEADYVLIATWNEFFEGTAIEPSKEYGDYYFNQTKQFIEKFKQ